MNLTESNRIGGEITNAAFRKGLKDAGLSMLHLIKGDGYFYVIADEGTPAERYLNALDSTDIYMNSFNQQSVDEWVNDVMSIYVNSKEEYSKYSSDIDEDFCVGVGGMTGADQGIPEGGDAKAVVAKRMDGGTPHRRFKRKKKKMKVNEGAGKLVYEDSKNFTINGKDVTVYLRQYEVKRRDRDYMGRNLKTWSTRVVTSGTCTLYPDCEWFPQRDGDQYYASFSCEGWEPKTKEFKKIDEIIDAMMGTFKGWPKAKNPDTLIAELNKVKKVKSMKVSEALEILKKKNCKLIKEGLEDCESSAEAQDMSEALLSDMETVRDVLDSQIKKLSANLAEWKDDKFGEGDEGFIEDFNDIVDTLKGLEQDLHEMVVNNE